MQLWRHSASRLLTLFRQTNSLSPGPSVMAASILVARSKPVLDLTVECLLRHKATLSATTRKPVLALAAQQGQHIDKEFAYLPNRTTFESRLSFSCATFESFHLKHKKILNSLQTNLPVLHRPDSVPLIKGYRQGNANDTFFSFSSSVSRHRTLSYRPRRTRPL